MKVDDSVLLRRGIIRKPSSFDKIRNDTVWLLGGYRKLTQRCSFLRESNIKIYTSCNAIKGEILLESTVFSNGYSLYPSVSRNLFFDCGNHNHGFVSSDGIHNNGIEGFWYHLKASMRKENGVKRENIDDWLKQYTFRRWFVMWCSREEFSSIIC